MPRLHWLQLLAGRIVAGLLVNSVLAPNIPELGKVSEEEDTLLYIFSLDQKK